MPQGLPPGRVVAQICRLGRWTLCRRVTGHSDPIHWVWFGPGNHSDAADGAPTDSELAQADLLARLFEGPPPEPASAADDLLLDLLPCPVFTKDLDGRYRSCNEPFARAICGLDKSSVLGRSALDMEPHIPSSLARVYREQDEHLLREGGVQVYEAPVACSDGSLRFFEFHKALLTGPDGRPDGIVGVMLDITDRVHSSEALAEAHGQARAASQAKSEFLARVSDQLRTPLTAVIGLADLLSETALDRHQRHDVEGIVDAARSLLRILDDVADYSRIEAGMVQADQIPFSLRECVFRAVREVAPAAWAAGLEMICRVEPRLRDAWLGDPARIRQVLGHLLSNALRFTQKGQIEVRVEPCASAGAAESLQFSVRDTGVGIDRQRQQGIFGPAQTGASHSAASGSGLGLAISTRLVDLMGGRIWLHSSPGEGSTFFFTLAVVAAGGPESCRTAPAGRALLVAQPGPTRTAALEGLEYLAITTELADGCAGAQAALARMQAGPEPILLVVADEAIGEQPLEALAQQLQANPALGNPRRVLLTRPGGAPPSLDWICLPKPVNPLDLARVLDEHLPVEGALLEAAPPEAAPADPLPGLQVLVADDNRIHRMLLDQLLGKWGCSVRHVTNGVEALLAVESESFDMLLIDLQMPEMGGLETTAAIRQREAVIGTHLPIVAMTAHALAADRQQCLKAGMDAFLAKPIHHDDLRQVLRDLCRRFVLRPVAF